MAKKLQVKLQDGTMQDLDLVAKYDEDGNEISTTFCKTNDSRLSNARTPTAHTHTKSEVGLGSVQNYGLATQAEAEAGSSSAKYMTPLRTKQAIEKLAAGGVEIIDNLTSTSTTAALSANQGRILKNTIGNIDGLLNTINGEVI